MTSNGPMTDTSPAIEALQIEGWRRMSGAAKLQQVRSLTEAVALLGLADIRRRHPHADEREQLLRLASRRVDPELLRRATGWDVRREGY